jgi:UDP-glucose 4-epimerase
MSVLAHTKRPCTSFRGIALRYFTPVGADPYIRTGPYDPNPSHRLGNLVEVAAGRKT